MYAYVHGCDGDVEPGDWPSGTSTQRISRESTAKASFSFALSFSAFQSEKKKEKEEEKKRATRIVPGLQCVFIPRVPLRRRGQGGVIEDGLRWKKEWDVAAIGDCVIGGLSDRRRV